MLTAEEEEARSKRQYKLYFDRYRGKADGHLCCIPLEGNPKPIPVDRRDRTVIMLAKFALDKYSFDNNTLNHIELRYVTRATCAVRRGRSYDITMLATNGRYFEAHLFHRTSGWGLDSSQESITCSDCHQI